MKIKLSILIPTVPRRLRHFFPHITEKLEKQINGRKDIEIVGLYDNKRMKLGDKRNNLLSIARGRYLTFVDDDDDIADTYIEDIMRALEKNPDADCVVYDVINDIDNYLQLHCRYGIEYEYHRKHNDWYGKPAHTHVWRSEIAKQCVFPSETFGEDMDWVAQAWPKIVKQVRIDKVLYYYNYNTTVTETRRVEPD